MTSLDIKVKALNNRLKRTNIKDQLSQIDINTEHQISAIRGIAESVKGSKLEGTPFMIAMMKAKLLTDKDIAAELDIPLRTVRNYSQIDGFNNLITQMMPAIWSDLIIAAQACLLHHISIEKDLNAAKWLLESLGQVASSRPLTNHTHQTLMLQNVTSTMPGNQNLLPSGDQSSLTVENLASAMFKRLADNSMTNNSKPIEPPPILISE